MSEEVKGHEGVLELLEHVFSSGKSQGGGEISFSPGDGP